MLLSEENITLERISHPAVQGINLFILRLDKIHPTISGNKYFKLKYNLEEAKQENKKTLLTFGGAYSNHIAATAATGKEFGLKTIGIIRGDEFKDTHQSLTAERKKSQTLEFAEQCGMQLHFVSREEYRKKETTDFITSLQKQFGDFYLLPEGGTNQLAVKGCSEIISHINIPFDFICCAAGTGGTLAGISSSLKESQQAIGFSALKAPRYHETEVKRWLDHFRMSTVSNFQINDHYHFGGYAKYTPELLQFIDDFEKQTTIPLEQVYTGKMMYGIFDLTQKNFFPQNSTVIAVHTGGLQGKLKY